MDYWQLQRKFKQTWRNVIHRCTNPRDKRYLYYSKVGVCEEWKKYINFYNDMFESFVDHAETYGLADTTIDRIRNDQPYSKNNCRWATWEIQRSNSSKGK